MMKYYDWETFAFLLFPCQQKACRWIRVADTRVISPGPCVSTPLEDHSARAPTILFSMEQAAKLCRRQLMCVPASATTAEFATSLSLDCRSARKKFLWLVSASARCDRYVTCWCLILDMNGVLKQSHWILSCFQLFVFGGSTLSHQISVTARRRPRLTGCYTNAK